MIEDSDGKKFCCSLRRFFIVAIVGTLREPAPVDLVDVSNVTEDGLVTVHLRYCPFCGEPITRDQHVRITQPLVLPDQDD